MIFGAILRGVRGLFRVKRSLVWLSFMPDEAPNFGQESELRWKLTAPTFSVMILARSPSRHTAQGLRFHPVCPGERGEDGA